MKKGKETRGRKQSESPQLGSIDPDSEESVERQSMGLSRSPDGRSSGARLGNYGRSIANASHQSDTGERCSEEAGSRRRHRGRNKSAYFVNELTREKYIDILNVRSEIECYAAG